MASELLPIYKKPQRQKRGRFKEAKALVSIKASKVFATYIASLLEPSSSHSSRSLEGSEPLQKRIKIIENRQDRLLSIIEELLKKVRKAPTSPI